MKGLRRRYGHAHLAEKKLWVKWMRARNRKSSKAYVLADKLQYKLQDMSAYGNSLVWGSEGRRLEDQWHKRHGKGRR